MPARSRTRSGGRGRTPSASRSSPSHRSAARSRRPDLLLIGGRILQGVGGHGVELWRSDGTTAATTLVADIQGGDRGSYPSGLVKIGDTVYFQAGDAVHGRELWKSDGTPAGTVLVKDIQPGAGGSTPSFLTGLNGALVFTANDG